MNKMIKVFGALVLLVGVIASVKASNSCNKSDNWCYVSGPTGSPTTQARLDSSGNLTTNGTISASGTGTYTIGGTILQGTSGVAISTANSSGNSLGIYVPMLLATGSANAAVEGSVLLSSTPISNQATVYVSTGNTMSTFVGIAQAAASTGSVVNAYTSGVVLALTTGTVSVGDLLVTTLTVTGAGYLATNNSASAYQAVAVAIGTESSATNGLTKVKIIR